MNKVLVRIIVEIVGFPKDHVEEVTKKIVDKIKEDKEVKKFEIFETVELKDKMDGFYSAFTELEINFNNLNELISFCLDYMPSSIEILEPEEINFKTAELANLLNDLLGKLHDYDMTIKKLQASNFLMKKKLGQN
ncbi:MAG: hypothetical protein AABX55_01050 [Nanoarchaeota archaeon]